MADYLFHYDGLHFHQNILGQTSDFDRRSGWLVIAKEGGVDGIHVSEVVHVLQEDRGFGDFVNSATARFDDLVQVLEGLSGLLSDPSLHDRH